MHVLVATEALIVVADPDRGTAESGSGLTDRPTCLAADVFHAARVWCGTDRGGVFRSDDAGASWYHVGLAGSHIMAIAASATEADVVRVGTEPSEMWSTRDAGSTWKRAPGLQELPSSSEWSFPPRPHTHHVRWIASHPRMPGRLWVAIEAGALVSTVDGGLTWRDRVPGGPYDTHELAIHTDAPDLLRVAAGDGYFESRDGGATWSSPRQGLDVTYLRSVATPLADVVVVSASSGPRTAYVAGVSDGRLYRRVGTGRWQRVRHGWPAQPSTIAPLLASGTARHELWAADERGVHRSADGGASWQQVVACPSTPHHLRGLAILT
jgi:photosystem II stability/assembly factor-like uncharacterized protein